jgi:hypothetical protein
MDRVCINKLTGRIIETQGGGDDRPDLMEMRLNTLRQNAINAGHKEADIEVKWVTEAELIELQKPTPEEAEALAKEAEIQAEITRIKEAENQTYRVQAITNIAAKKELERAE